MSTAREKKVCVYNPAFRKSRLYSPEDGTLSLRERERVRERPRVECLCLRYREMKETGMVLVQLVANFSSSVVECLAGFKNYSREML